jgi:hypothetical protein
VAEETSNSAPRSQAGAAGHAARPMNEARVALAGALQIHAIEAGASFEMAGEIALRVLAAHQGEIRSWENFQAMVAEVRAAAGPQG